MPGLLETLLIAAAVAVPQGQAGATERPIKLLAEPTSNGLLVRVVGQSSTDLKLNYRLELAGGGGGSNRVNQGGVANLRAGMPPQTLATVRISGTFPEGRLIVEGPDGISYEQAVGEKPNGAKSERRHDD